MDKYQIKVKITVNAERYYNEDSCWGVYTFTTSDNIPYYQPYSFDPFNKDGELKLSTLAGKVQRLITGQEYNATLIPTYNDKYKTWQYSPIIVSSCCPKTPAEQKLFLESILTPLQTQKLLTQYPNIVSDIISGQDIDINIIQGIGEREWLRCKQKIIENYGAAEILVMLSPLGVTYNMIQKLILEESQPELLKQKLLDNPYLMTKIKGLGFKKIDDLALKLKPNSRVSLQRLLAYIKYYFHSIGENDGHTYVTIDELKKNVVDNVSECLELFNDFLTKQQQSQNFLKIEGDKIGLNSYYKNEKQVYDILKYLSNIPLNRKFDNDTINKGIAKAEQEQGFQFDKQQIDLINKAIIQSVVFITGKAGTGKTTITRALLNICKLKQLSINCCALSAKAAQRITEATGFKASTIHRMLEFQGEQGFKFNEDNPLQCDVLLIDEFSMVNIPLALSVFKAVKEGTQVIICGDNRQLPPIGYGNAFNDLLNLSNDFNVYKLEKVHRQAEKSGILTNANQIREGIDPLPTKELRVVTGENQDMIYQFRTNKEGIREIAIKSFLNAVDKFGLDNVVIITPRKSGCINSTAEINAIIQNALISDNENSIEYGDSVFKQGAKVIQRQNNYDKNVFNGEIGYITDIDFTDTKKPIITVKYSDHTVEYTKQELSQIQLAYALTVHVSQGSGYDCVICIIDNSDYILLDTCLLYTALTRAKQKCMLLAEPSAYNKAIKTNKTTSRQTWMSTF